MSSSSKSYKELKVKTKTHSHDSIPSFIRKTYDILEERKFPDIIDWNPEGTALVIKKPTEFCQKVLPTYFKHNNLTSFVRQLNMYNFHKRRTQNIDHVYYHELFQKGKKNLLKEIRRKNQGDSGADKSQKVIETADTPQSTQDHNSLAYENQVLKRLYNDAMTKLAQLEAQIKDMSTENQSLWGQLCMKQENDMSPEMLLIRKQQSGLTQDQLPMTLSNISIPPLKLNIQRQISGQGYLPIAKGHRFFGTGEELGGSVAATETSRDSPNAKRASEGEKGLELQDGLALQLPQLSGNPQVSQMQALKAYNDLNVSRQEMSVGQLFEAWNAENVNPDAYGSLLGKRQLDLGDGNGDYKFQVPEPPMKRHELSIFNRRSLMSTGTEEKELLRSLLRRDSSIGEDIDHSTGLDLMDFNHPFFAFSKTS